MASKEASMTPKGIELGKENTDEYLGKIVDVFKPFLLRSLSPSQLLVFINLEEVRSVASQVHRKDNDQNCEEASRILLDAITRSEEPGKWRIFINALVEVGDTAILSTLLEEEGREDDWLDNQENRNLIHIFSNDIESNLNLGPLLPAMEERGLIVGDERGTLEALLRDGKERYANFTLLMVMHRHNRDWYKAFLSILHAEPQHLGLVRKIDPEQCRKMDEQARGGNGASMTTPSPPSQQSFEVRERGSSSSPAIVNPPRQPSALKMSGSGDKRPTSESLRVNTASVGQTKALGVKSLPHSDIPDAESSLQRLNPGQEPAQGSPCVCCEKVLEEVRELRTELAEMKNLMKTLLQKMNT